MIDQKNSQLKSLLISDMKSNCKIRRFLSYKYQIKYDLATDLLNEFERLCKNSPAYAIDDLKSRLYQMCQAYAVHQKELEIDMLCDVRDFSYNKFRYKRIMVTMCFVKYWIGVISYLQVEN